MPEAVDPRGAPSHQYPAIQALPSQAPCIVTFPVSEAAAAPRMIRQTTAKPHGYYLQFLSPQSSSLIFQCHAFSFFSLQLFQNFSHP